MANSPAPNRFEQLPVISTFRQNDKIDDFFSLLRQHDAGIFTRSAMHVDELMTDDRILGTSNTRVGALKAAPFKIDPAGEKRLQKKIAEKIGGVDGKGGLWETICSTSTLGELLHWGMFLGIAVAEIVWTRKTDDWSPRLVPWNPTWVRWYEWEQRFVLQTRNGQVTLPNPDEQPHGDGKWFVWCPYGFRYGWRRGLVRALALKYMSRNWNERDWDRYNEIRSMGLLKGMLPATAQPEHDARFMQGLQNMGQEPVVFCPQGSTKDTPGYDVQAVEFASRNWETLKERKGDLNTDIAVLILGQNLTTEMKEGSLAGGKVQNLVRIDKALEDAAIGTAFRNQVLCPWAEANFKDPELAPWPKYEVQPPEDDKGEAEALKLLGEAGQALLLADPQVDIATLFESEGIPRLSDEEFAAQQAAEAEAAAERAAMMPPAPDGQQGGDGGDAGSPEKEKPQQPQGDKKKTVAASMALGGMLENVVRRYQFQGLDIAVENQSGSIRRWTDASGKMGHTVMKCDYGFIEGCMGADKEELDVYVGPVEDAPDVYVIHQHGVGASGRLAYDEDKCMLGFASADDAKACFLAHRDDGERAYGGMLVLPVDRFKAKLRRRGDSTNKIRASMDIQGSLVALAGRARTRKNTVAGNKRNAKYQEALIANGTKRAAAALAPFLVGLKAEIDHASSFAELRKSIVRHLSKPKSNATAETLALVIKRTNILANLSGQATATEEV